MTSGGRTLEITRRGWNGSADALAAKIRARVSMDSRRAHTTATDPRPGNRPVALAALELGVLVALLGALLWGFRGHLDLHAWDEAIYHRGGLQLAEGKISGYVLAWAPGLSAAYALLTRFPLGGAHANDVMIVCCAVASTLALWWAFRALLGPAVGTAIAAFWVASLPAHIQTGNMAQTNVYVFVAGLCFAALGCIARGKHRTALVVLAFAGFTRPEISFFTILYGAGIAVAAFRSSSIPRGAAVATPLVGIALAAMHMTLPDARDRSWLVFRQHYGMGLQERKLGTTDAKEVALAHLDPDPLVAESFSGADSIASAALANPGAMAEHMLANLLAIAEPLTTVSTRAFAWAPPLRWSLVGLLAALAVLGLGRLPRPWLRCHRPWAVWIFLGASLLTVPINLLVRPRPELLLGLLPLVFTVAGGLAGAGGALLVQSRGIAASAPRWIVVACVLALLALAPRPFGPLQRVQLNQRTFVPMLERADLEPKSSLVAHNATNLLSYTRHQDVVPLNLIQLCHTSRAPFASVAEMLEKRDPDYLLATQFAWGLQPLGMQLLEEISSDRWELLDFTPIGQLFRRVR